MILVFMEHMTLRKRFVMSHASVGGPPGPWVTTPEAAPSAVARGPFWAESNGPGLDRGPQRPDTLSCGLWRQGAAEITPTEWDFYAFRRAVHPKQSQKAVVGSR